MSERAVQARQPIFQRGDDPGDRALGERRRLEQRPQRAADPPLVPPGQVRRDHRLVHLAHPALIARHDRRAPFAARRPQRGAGQRERQRPGRARQGARLEAVAVAAPPVVALVAPGPERDRQLFVHGRLDRDPDLGMNQLAQRGRPIFRQPLRLLDTLRHGAFLRRPSCRTAGWWLDFPPEECAISLFPHHSGHHHGR